MAVGTGTAIMAGAAVAGPIIGGIMGQEAARGNREAAQRAAAEAYAELMKIGTPPDLSKRIIMEQFKKVGAYTPKLEEDIQIGTSKVEQIKEDPGLRDTQLSALQMIKDRAAGGMSAQDRMDLNKIRQQTAISTQGKLEALRQKYAGNQGALLAAELSATQSGAAEEAAMSDRLAAQAQQAALQAALQSGQLGGQLRTQDFEVNRARAEAADRFKQFDVQNAVARQQRNVGSENQGQMYNLSESQRLSDVNTQMENAERQRQNAATRQYWQDQKDLATTRSNAKLGQASQLNAAANAEAQQWQQMGAGVGAAAGAGLNYMGRAKAAGPSNVGIAPDGEVFDTTGRKTIDT